MTIIDLPVVEYFNGLTGEPAGGDERTAPPNAVATETRGRIYLHPLTAERFLSVTTALSILEKAALPFWYSKIAAIEAVTLLKQLTAAPAVPFCDPAGPRCRACLTCLMGQIRYAPERERDIAADRGTRFHKVVEQYALTGRWISYADDLKPFMVQFERFMAIHKVEFQAAEFTGINRANMYAGTNDAVIACGWMPPKWRHLIGVPAYTDWKTGNNVYESAGLQLAGNRNAEAVMLPDGTEVPLPYASDEWALSVQITAEDFWVRPCPVGPDAFTKFLRALALWRDINEPDLDLVGRAMYKPPRKVEPETAPSLAA